ncbi:hypothetical protein SAMN02745824_2712 [Parasphingorhabdus marina DSM 22363]|uniref:Cardiolipin synthase N-terminal domain-containing protein n=2 Tax=Parasphingorhabdus marina TaxID=394732 RepID=A0A1N6G7M9_9SPHN|nr:hypothetical protein SAMN02745824_2712 [Parasphingorhabdus marina DSM 22363]
MPYFILTILVQILCVVHLMKSGRNKLWLTAIIFLPIAGSAAYFLLEILPDLTGNRHMRYAKKKAVQKVDPDREIRQARERLALTDSLTNHVQLADALADSGRFEEAADCYAEIIAKPHGNDDRTLVKYARALFESGEAAKALDIIKPIAPVAVATENGQREILKARIHAELGQLDEADKIFGAVIEKVSGIEARGHYAALLLQMGENDRAKEQLTELCTLAKRMSHAQLDDDRAIVTWAHKELDQLQDV